MTDTEPGRYIPGRKDHNMDYIVRADRYKDGKFHSDFWEFETEEEANDFADWKAKQLRKHGYEFHVRVYKLIG